MTINQMIENLQWIVESNPVAFGHPASEEDIRDEEDLAGFYVQEIIESLKQMQSQDEFVKTEDQLPTFRHEDWDYDSVGVIGVLKSESGTRYVKPVYYERTKIRGKRVERWKDWYGRLLQGYEVTHWRKFPAPPVEESEKG